MAMLRLRELLDRARAGVSVTTTAAFKSTTDDTTGFAPAVTLVDDTGTATDASATRALDWTNGQKISIGAASGLSTAIAADEVVLHATADSFVKVGDVSAIASNAAGSLPMLAGEKYTLRITSGQFVAVIRSVSNGDLFIMPVV